MADNPALYGFRWIGSRGTSIPKPEIYRVASGYQAAPGAVNCDLNPGDPVIKVSDGTVAIATTGVVFGVIIGVEPFYDGTKMVRDDRLPGNTVYGSVLERQSKVLVIPVADQLFECVADENTTATTQAAYTAFIGENVDLVMVPVAPLATPRLDISTHAVTNTLGWRIVNLGRGVNIDYTGNFVPLVVTANLPQQAPFTILGV